MNRASTLYAKYVGRWVFNAERAADPDQALFKLEIELTQRHSSARASAIDDKLLTDNPSGCS